MKNSTIVPKIVLLEGPKLSNVRLNPYNLLGATAQSGLGLLHRSRRDVQHYKVFETLIQECIDKDRGSPSHINNIRLLSYAC